MGGIKRRRCVVFDLDDTLFNEIDFVRSGYAAVARHLSDLYGRDTMPFLNERIRSERFARALDDLVVLEGLPASALPAMIDLYRHHMPSIVPRDGVVEALIHLANRDGVIGCITDGRSRTQRNKIRALGLEGLLSPVLISEETGHQKSDPHNFRAMMDMVGDRHYYYVADNPFKDFLAPNTLGWTTIHVRNGVGVHRESVPPSAAHHAALTLSLAEALALLTTDGGDSHVPR